MSQHVVCLIKIGKCSSTMSYSEYLHINRQWACDLWPLDYSIFQYLCRPSVTPTLPSTFLSKRSAALKGSRFKTKEKVFTYDRDIICLPKSYGSSSSIPIPRSRTKLAQNGLIGKIRLRSDMTQEDIFHEIRSVFRGPMEGSSTFLFDVLQPAGGHSKSLTAPALSGSFKWTASAIVSKNAKVPLYILAKESLKKVFYVYIWHHS